MGCTTSKLDNEDTVRRCKDRRRLIKEAVFARHHLAAAHADYCRSLRLTGSALSSFAAGEPLSVSEQTPAVFLHPPAPPSSANSVPPPLPPSPSPSPSIASSKLPHILSASSNRLRRKQQQPPPAATKLPHILSQSSLSSSPARSEMSNFTANYAYPTAYQADSTYSATPSQASSVWNWENFRPPSPPDSEFFNHNPTPPPPPQKHMDLEEADDERTETGTEPSDYDFFHKKQGYAQPMENPTVGGRKYSIDEDEAEQEEVHCSEWGDDHDRYSTTSSSDEGGEDKAARSEIGTRSNFGGSMRGEEEEVSDKYRSQKQQTPSPPPSSRSYRKASESDMRMVVRHKDLKEIVESINENFERAAAAGDQVSELLEMGRAQLDRSFRQLKKTVYHSSSVLSNLSSSWTSKPPLAVKYRLDTAALSEPGGTRSLCSTLERLLAWEKKLYDEVKARESVKIEHEKKLSTLQSQEYKGGDRAKLDKTKTSINRLQSLIIVTSQAVSTTSTAIVGLRDADLVPQLVDLCHGFMYMWRSMHQYHEVQNNIVQQVSGLVNRSMNGHSTSELHRQATRDLESAVSAWHSSFNRLMKYQRDFIRSIQTWFKLTLLPVTNHSTNTTNNLSTIEHSDVVYTFCDEWKLALDRVPDTVASEAIKSFINVVHVISAKQTEELKMKKRTETASKELEKKASSLRNIERKFYQSYSMVGVGMPDEGGGHGLDARDPLSEKKSELATCQRRVEDEMVKHGKAVEVTRAMTLNNLQTGLPGVFQALTSFSALFTEALDTVCTHSYGIK